MDIQSAFHNGFCLDFQFQLRFYFLLDLFDKVAYKFVKCFLGGNTESKRQKRLGPISYEEN